jgi:hypothetical protein
VNPPEEFLKHAADCEKMARSTRDPKSSATWNRMAERWRQCAEKFTREKPSSKRSYADAPPKTRTWLGSPLRFTKEAPAVHPHRAGASSICAAG